MSEETSRNYELANRTAQAEFPAPDLPYQPPTPRQYRPKLGLIGCGGITASHLDAYRAAGWPVVMLCDLDEARARARREEFGLDAEVATDYRRLLDRRDIEVVDVALHPEGRAAVIADALHAGKHVLSQKPFVLDLDEGERLVELARQCRRKLAVNQNGRWAPYVQYTAQAIRAGLLGQVQTVHMRLNWDHTWTRGTPFESIGHLVLYDFGIHWFDMAVWFFEGRRPRRVFASEAAATGQPVRPPLLATAMIEFDQGLAGLMFDGHSKFGPQETIQVTGTQGTIRTWGEVVANEQVELFTAQGRARPRLQGRWFNDGFRGAMGELLCAIEEDREPIHSAENNLRSLAVCFAAIASAETGRPCIPGEVRRIKVH